MNDQTFSSSGEIRPARTITEQRDALELLVRDSGSFQLDHDVSLILNQAETGEFDLTNLLVASQTTDEQNSSPIILGAILLIVQPDGTGLVWPPSVCVKNVIAEKRNEIRDCLLNYATKVAHSCDCTHMQCSVSADQEVNLEVFQKSKFQELGNLLFLARKAAMKSGLPRSAMRKNLKLIPYQKIIDEYQLAKLIDRTYENSQDFPELQGQRTGEQAIRSHQTQGKYHPEWWLVIEHEGEGVGILFFAEHTEFEQVELIYIGITEKYRKQGFAKTALAQALQKFERDEKSVFLGVDARNHPAVRLYASLGFVQISEQRILFRPLKKHGD
ncbi:GNAT family N-acetyltransferase [Rubinisphaera italica]|uniref:Mycothiol acetyltransferase n=1 Tax=Rubinisphaera italica TaxID=2527969 RepID=A0A5C5XGJ1_9PLAN|nr:GNAT family N-acetyltransferase [Rubinisphaera italica]TWT62197.1 Mycothiol acetyltransferase [Rubinisphaera italica]